MTSTEGPTKNLIFNPEDQWEATEQIAFHRRGKGSGWRVGVQLMPKVTQQASGRARVLLGLARVQDWFFLQAHTYVDPSFLPNQESYPCAFSTSLQSWFSRVSFFFYFPPHAFHREESQRKPRAQYFVCSPSGVLPVYVNQDLPSFSPLGSIS